MTSHQPPITSFRNPLIKRIKRLRQKKYRQAEGVFFADGLRVVLTALEQGARIESLVYAPDLLRSDPGRDAITTAQQNNVPTHAVTADIFQSISERDNPAGLSAIIHSPITTLANFTITPTSLFVALHEPSDPGNVGTILRTLDAVDGAGLILIGNAVDPLHPTAIKASMGTIFTRQVATTTPAQFQHWLTQHTLHTLATSAKATHDYRQATYQLPGLLLMGSERHGLPQSLLNNATQAISLPMSGSASSLNVAVATGILLYQWQHQVSNF